MSPRKYIRLFGFGIDSRDVPIKSGPAQHFLLFADKLVNITPSEIIGGVTTITDTNNRTYAVKHTVDEILAKIFMKPEKAEEATNG